VTAFDLAVEILEKPDAGAAAGRGARVSGQLDEIELVRDGYRPGEIREEDDARLQRRDEDGVAAVVVRGDVAPELPDPRRDRGRGEKDLPDALVAGPYEANFRPYR
jgi:hypothetical protein